LLNSYVLDDGVDIDINGRKFFLVSLEICWSVDELEVVFKFVLAMCPDKCEDLPFLNLKAACLF